MALISPTLPTIGQPNSTEDADVLSALNTIVNAINGSLDNANLAVGTLTKDRLATSLQELLVPTGAVFEWVQGAAPTGYLLCDGTAVSRSTYSALNGVLSAAGYPYGTGDGSTTFNVPDFRGRAPVGLGTHADVNALGDNDGAALASRRPGHTHDMANHVHDMAHTHPFSGSTGASSSNGAKPGTDPASVPDSTHGHAFSGTTGTSSFANTGAPSTNNSGAGAPSFVVVSFIIKT